MYNKDLYSKIENKFGKEKTTEFCEMVSFMHEILYREACRNGTDEFTEHDYDRDWWIDKHRELKNIKK